MDVALQTSHIHKRYVKIVHGFVHLSTFEINNKLNVNGKYLNIPDLILTLCTLFYNGNDHFISCSTKMRISKSKPNCIVLQHQGMNWSTAVGSTIIDFKKNPTKLFYEWTIVSNTNEIFIGIDSTPNIRRLTDNVLDSNIFNVYNEHKYYGWCSLGRNSAESLLVTNDKTSQFPVNWKHGIRGKIKMIIDCNNKQIIFVRDQQNLGITFENIDLSKKYHLAICLYKKGSWVQIIDETNYHY